MKITALTENTSRTGLPTEHGLSLWIETGKLRVLFDMGQSALFAENAGRLGIDLSAADIAVLSHGHYDHGGGLGEFLKINKSAPVYMSRFAFEPHYNGEKYIGLDLSLRDNPRIIFTGGETKIAGGLTLYCAEGRVKRAIPGADGLLMIRNGKRLSDDFRHEQYLMIEENGKRVLISACSHRGIINITERFRPDALVGGFHFHKLPPGGVLTDCARQLNSFGIDFYTCHCTGEEQYRHMQPYIDRLSYISAGDTIIL